MATERAIGLANEVLRNFRARFGKRKSRIHDETVQTNFDKQRALNGVCGNCTNLDIFFHGNGRSRSIHLDCRAGNNPIALYENTPLENTATCPDARPKTQTPDAQSR